MLLTDFENILKIGEHISVEFKRGGCGAQDDTFETICAFLNRAGGDVFLGVNDNGTVVGLPEGEVKPIVNRIIKTMNNATLFEPTFAVFPEVIEYEGKSVIRIRVPVSSAVHRFRGVCYDRVDESDIRVSATETIAQMYIRKQNFFTERRIFPYVEIFDLRTEQLKKVRQLAMLASKDGTHPWRDMSDEELFKSAGLIGRDYLSGASGFNAAAVLLLGKDDVIRNCFPAYKTDAIMRRENIDRYDDRETVYSDLIEAYEKLMAFGAKHLDDKFYLERDQRISLVNKILREVIGNLLIHREYSSSRPARLIIEKTHLTADNANKALHYGDITLDNLDPLPKNPIIANFFHQIGWADELGSGVRNLYKYVKRYSDSRPVFTEADVFTLTIPLIKTETTEKTTEKTVSTTEKIVELLIQQPNVSMSELAEICGMSEDGIYWQIKKLRTQGAIRRVGPDKGGYWEVMKK